jgi:1-acyl-sn-glycerol-3-phosphate acyltransferase
MSKKSLPGTASMFVRSCLFAVVVPIFTIFHSFVCVASYPFPLRMRYRVVTFWTNSVVWLLKVICCIDYQVTGKENMPTDRSGVLMSKHQSAWETFYLPGQLYEVAIILKRELYWVPFFGWGMKALDPIAINRSDKKSALTQIIEKGKKCIEAGRWILVFPEGTRIMPGHVGKYHLGGARLAVAAGCPVLPVAHNAGRFWYKRKFIKRPGTIRVVFGPLIETVGRTPEEVLGLTKEWIETTVREIDSNS